MRALRSVFGPGMGASITGVCICGRQGAESCSEAVQRLCPH